MTRRTGARLIAFGLVFAVLALAACGGDGDDSPAGSGTRTIEIEMRDIAFSPDQLKVRAGENVRFVFKNVGKVRHDAFIGDNAAQEDHEMEMRRSDTSSTGTDMQHGTEGRDAEGGVTVEPGETGELMHTFREGDELLIGCHEPGHYAAGMKITIDVG